MYRLPHQLVAEILQWLPVEDVLSLRCVSREWKSLIDSPYFINLHLQSSLQTNSRLKLITVQEQHVINERLKGTASALIDAYAAAFDDGLKKAIKLKLPVTGFAKICGSCNGLILLYDYDDIEFVLWNPFTRRSRKLPTFPVEYSPAECIPVGFACDSATDDYKVVLILEFHESCLKNSLIQIWVFSLRSNSWRKAAEGFRLKYEGGNSYWNYEWPATFVDGAFHWPRMITNDSLQNDFRIFVFDLAMESFHEVEVPKPPGTKWRYPNLGELKGSLCLNVVTLLDSDKKLEVYLYIREKLDDGKFIWRQLHRGKLSDESDDLYSERHWKPLGCLEEGDEFLLLANCQDFAWYDLKQKRGEMIDCFSNTLNSGYAIRFTSSSLCCESLVSLGDDSKFD